MSDAAARRLPRNQILAGDALTRLSQLPESGVDTVVTSPPYFRVRDYQVSGQIGLEHSVEDWVRNLRAVAGEIARVLVPTGTLWLNLGDTYSTHARQGAERKSLLMAPERLALALLRDGWLVRSKIVWAKSNGLPTSAGDRFASKYEVIYLLSRSPRYFFDLDAIRVPHTSRPPKPRDATRRPRDGRPPSRREAWRGPNSDGDAGLKALRARGLVGHPLGKNPGDIWNLSVSNYRGTHFSTFPEHLVERIDLAGIAHDLEIAGEIYFDDNAQGGV